MYNYCEHKRVDRCLLSCYDGGEFEERSENMIKKFKNNISIYIGDEGEKIVFSHVLNV